jgi:N-acyl-D-aspartate/D-glutamate deacylase
MERLSSKARATIQLAGRSSGTLLNFLTANPFTNTPSFERMAGSLPRDRWLSELALPEVKRQILSEHNRPNTGGQMMSQAFDRMFELDDDWDYEPTSADSIASRARREGRDVREFAYDMLLSHGVTPRLWVALINYADCNLDTMGQVLRSPAAIVAGSDAGAHTLHVVDASLNSFMLAHWVRDRTRGPRIPLEQVVHLMTRKPALSAGLPDRGTLALGMKADINVIDLDSLKIHAPYFAEDLPAKARRILQDVTGYRATIVSGKVTRENDEATGELPGKLARRRMR